LTSVLLLSTILSTLFYFIYFSMLKSADKIYIFTTSISNFISTLSTLYQQFLKATK